VSIDELKEAFVKAQQDEWKTIRARNDEVLAATRRIHAEWNDRVRQVMEARANANRALSEAQAAAGSHPWEGKRVRRAVKKWRSYHNETIEQTGIVEIRRLDTVMPAGQRYGLPDMGEWFVRLTKKDGTPGTRIETEKTGWQLEEGAA